METPIEISMEALKKKKKIPREAAVPLLGIYLKLINSTLFLFIDAASFGFPVTSPRITREVFVRDVPRQICLKTEAVSILSDEMQQRGESCLRSRYPLPWVS